MNIIQFNAAIAVKEFTKHDILKEQILEYINDSPAENIKTKQGSDISRCDWGLVNLRREWVHELMPLLEPEVVEIFNNLGYQYCKIYNIWFQQYSKNSFHNWHVHTECQWTSVYYLDLPDATPRTELIDPITKKIVTLDIKEGDIVCFPSFVIHRAPINQSEKTKTIISFNSGTDIGEGVYQ
jgi:hypothetical protein